ncbi:MAG: 3-hydroxybutyryl-CoA dehydrogenase [Chromatiales bacterium]|jgi:3-hydroxybutyryl-CoA dehydrogenase|nr:3-hydroxybutyryl-CoA dehydrogenase [Chromatiales bacterium]
MQRIVSVGAGRMGRGIAHVMAYAGFDVTLVDLKPRAAAEMAALEQACFTEIAANLATLTESGLMGPADEAAINGRIGFVGLDGANAAIAAGDVIFEGVPEVMEAKQACLARIGDVARPDAIVASTTSTFSAETLANHVAHPERFLNAHWLNPAYLIPVVEVSPTERTDEATTEGMLALLRAAGKMPIRCKPAPGFIIPRIQALAMNEAARLVEEGVATPEDIDTATRYGFGVRFAILGLLEFIDYGGGDILYYASRYLSKELGDDRHAAPDIVNDMMERGDTGLRAGQGFYNYTDRDVDEYQRETIRKFVDLLAHLELLPQPHGARQGS